jgi:hypothetical protein
MNIYTLFFFFLLLTQKDLFLFVSASLPIILQVIKGATSKIENCAQETIKSYGMDSLRELFYCFVKGSCSEA